MLMIIISSLFVTFRLDVALKMFQQAANRMRGDHQYNILHLSKSNNNISNFAVEILSNLATTYRMSGRLDEALALYDECLKMDCNDPLTHVHMGFTLHLAQRCL